jgi:hypothetical protein
MSGKHHELTKRAAAFTLKHTGERAVDYARGAHSPVAALANWLTAADITDGAVFDTINRHGCAAGLSDRAIALIVKWRAMAAGIDLTDYSDSSLHAGRAKEAAASSQYTRLHSGRNSLYEQSASATGHFDRLTDRPNCLAHSQ